MLRPDEHGVVDDGPTELQSMVVSAPQSSETTAHNLVRDPSTQPEEMAYGIHELLAAYACLFVSSLRVARFFFSNI
ncbi:unnamed protein product [Urochloa humidicola]